MVQMVCDVCSRRLREYRAEAVCRHCYRYAPMCKRCFDGRFVTPDNPDTRFLCSMCETPELFSLR